jgi:ribosomal protein S12 methylthiotransferase accessory factor
MGITRVANLTGLDTIGIPVVAVMRPNSKSLAVAQGKGLDLTAAKVSGLMEAVETYHAENIAKALVLDSEAGLRALGANVIDVQRLPRVSCGSYHTDQRILWIEGHEALTSRHVWVPFEVVHADYTVPLPTGSGAFLMTTNGLASGNHPLEATSHALCEVVERDAVTLWQHHGGVDQVECRLDLDTVEDDACRSVLERFTAADVSVGVWDVTSDIGISAFFCEIIDNSSSPWRSLGPTSGSGCHPCRGVALLRALTEAAQARLTVIAGSRDDLGVGTYLRGRDAELVSRCHAVMAQAAKRVFAKVPTHDGATFTDDLAWELERLAGAGVGEVAVVDLTKREFEIPVVRVIVPGLEGIADAPGYVAGHRARARVS